MIETKHTVATTEDSILLKLGWPRGGNNRIPAMYLWEQLYLMEQQNFDRVYEFLCDLRAFEEYITNTSRQHSNSKFWWYRFKDMTRVTEYDPRESEPYYKITIRHENLEILIERIHPESWED